MPSSSKVGSEKEIEFKCRGTSVRSRVHGRRRGLVLSASSIQAWSADHACVRSSANCTHKSNLTERRPKLLQQGAIYFPSKGVGSQALQKCPTLSFLLDPASLLCTLQCCCSSLDVFRYHAYMPLAVWVLVELELHPWVMCVLRAGLLVR
uniref:Uncharacterized protein n=1 Tax=Setaria viridis TaxID=4556 RepID=A0A4U6U972_SETVI|nr:hypothetical protein SEVIR_6G160866v2 [Setaria viridis]